MSDHFDVFEDDPVEQGMKAMIADHYYQQMRRQRDQARELAARLEEELEQLKNGGQA